MVNNLGNKQTMADNIRYYIGKFDVTSKEMCEVLDVPPSTFSYWLNARTYPRIDKIEKMASFFHVTKADLVEDRNSMILMESISSEELAMIKRYRKASEKEKQSIQFILKEYE